MNIIRLVDPTPQEISQLVRLWEASVKETHNFLTYEDIVSLRPAVEKGLGEIKGLYIIAGEEGDAKAFMGVQGDKLEMLFVDPAHRGKGMGEALLHYATHRLDVTYLDVNEQNTAAHGFYTKQGFTVFSRSEKDPMGNPFPILHLKLEKEPVHPAFDN